MKKINVLVTGVGAIIGYGIAKSLKCSSLNISVIGTDIYDDAFGKRHCDKFVKNILASDGAYINHMLDMCSEQDIDIVIPGIEQDLFALSKARSSFNKKNIELAINNYDLVDLCKDKYSFFTGIKTSRGLLIDSEIDNYSRCKEKFGLPFLLKPRRSYASKGISKIECENDFDYWKAKLKNNFMVQPIVGDDENEFTASVFGFGDGSASSSMIFKRKLSGEGATAKAELVVSKKIDDAIRRLSHELKPLGPTNFQFRLDKGQVKLLEINPRISSATSLRLLCGYNEAEACVVHYLLKKKPNIIPDTTKIGTVMGRYIEDYIVV